jgi:hypothetical protein
MVMRPVVRWIICGICVVTSLSLLYLPLITSQRFTPGVIVGAAVGLAVATVALPLEKFFPWRIRVVLACCALGGSLLVASIAAGN